MTNGDSDAEVRRLLDKLQSSQPEVRVHAADVISDIVQSLDDQDTGEVILEALLAEGIEETDQSAREAIFHAMVELCSRFQFGVDTLRPLVEKVDSLDEQSLEYVLWVLASTHDPSVRHVIERFVDHDSAVVREGVADALSELGDPA